MSRPKRVPNQITVRMDDLLYKTLLTFSASCDRSPASIARRALLVFLVLEGNVGYTKEQFDTYLDRANQLMAGAENEA